MESEHGEDSDGTTTDGGQGGVLITGITDLEKSEVALDTFSV
jgi:serine kinase of HPr protein (carbohydrate metabolism regulator)